MGNDVKDEISVASTDEIDAGIEVRRTGLTHDVYGELKPKLRGLIHAWAAVPVGIAGLLLIILSPTVTSRFAVTVYVLAVTGMLTASACYHRLRVTERTRNYLRRLDHSMIGVCVAGTYTPVLIFSLDGGLRIALLALLWAGAAGAMLVSIFWPGVPNWLRAGIYLLLGVSGIAVMPWVLDNSGVGAFVMIIVGGVLYGIGALAYATRKPNWWPAYFGFHEVFHTFVVLAAIAHFIAVGLVIAHSA